MDSLIERAASAVRVLDVEISPDGSQIAYVTREASEPDDGWPSTIWTIPTVGGVSRRLTSSGAFDSQPRWSPDGQWLAFLSDRRKAGTNQTYLISMSGGEAFRITDRPTSISTFAWSPDGQSIAFLSPDEETDEEKRRREQRDDARVIDSHDKMTGLWVIDISDDMSHSIAATLPEARRVSPEGIHVGGYVDAGFAWAPDSSGFVVMAGTSSRTNDRIRSQMYLLDLDGTMQSLGVFEGITSSPRFSPDGSMLAFIGAEDEIPARWVLQTVPASGGSPSVVASGFEGAFHSFAWLPDGDRLLTGVEMGQRDTFLIADLESSVLLPVSGFENQAGSGAKQFSCTPDGRHFAFIWSDASSYGDVYVAEIGGPSRRLTDLNPWTREIDWGEMREICWMSLDGLDIQGLLILPVGYQDGTRYPLMTHIHGGPAAAWTYTLYAEWHDIGQFLARRGYAVFLPNPRGSTGRGVEFLRGITHTYGESDWKDIESGIDHLIDLGIADPERLVVGGWSGGGFLTNWAITHTNRFKAAIVGAGTSNWISFLGTADIRDVFSRYVGRIEEDPETAWRLSPIRLVNQVTIPTLYLHGEQDDRVPVTQAYEMYEGLRSRGIETQLVTYPREGHSIHERKHQIDLIKRVIDWYDQHLPSP